MDGVETLRARHGRRRGTSRLGNAGARWNLSLKVF